MEATAKGRFYASKYEAERLENGLKEKGWYVADGSHEHFNLVTKDGGLIKFSKLARDAYKGYNVEIVKAKNPEELCKERATITEKRGDDNEQGYDHQPIPSPMFEGCALEVI